VTGKEKLVDLVVPSVTIPIAGYGPRQMVLYYTIPIILIIFCELGDFGTRGICTS